MSRSEEVGCQRHQEWPRRRAQVGAISEAGNAADYRGGWRRRSVRDGTSARNALCYFYC